MCRALIRLRESYAPPYSLPTFAYLVMCQPILMCQALLKAIDSQRAWPSSRQHASEWVVVRYACMRGEPRHGRSGRMLMSIANGIVLAFHMSALGGMGLRREPTPCNSGRAVISASRFVV